MHIVLPEFKRFATKVVFYGIPYNAATSIYNHLGYANVTAEKEEEINLNFNPVFFPHFCLKPEQIQKFAPSVSLLEYFSFCVVRDPWDRVVSMYKSVLSDPNNTYALKGVDFLYFCEVLNERKDEKDFMFSCDQYDWADYPQKPPFLLRFENLREDFSNMIKEINLISVDAKLPFSPKKKREHYSNYFNSQSKKIISSVFEKDIDTFKYSFIDQDPGSSEPKESKGFLRI